MKPSPWICLAVVGACAEPPPMVTVLMTATEAAPAYGTTPFPTDAVRDGDHLGRIDGLGAIAGLHVELIEQHLAALDGFGVRPLVEIFVDGDLAAGAIPARTQGLAEPLALVDVDPASPERGRVIAMDWHHDAARRVIAGSPATGVPLREGTRYAAIITTGVVAADGAPVAASPDLDRLAAHAPARWRTTADAVAALGLGDRLAGLAVFTTGRPSAPLVAARTALAAAPAPVLVFDRPEVVFAGTAALDRMMGQATRATTGPRAGLERWGNDNPTGLAHDHVGVVGTGTITVVRFRGDDTGTDGPEDEAFELDPATGVPRVRAIEAIPITFILPAAPPPAAGYPVVIYGHGLGAGRDQLLSFAEPLTAQGYALVGIDMVGHGSRFDAGDDSANLASQVPGFTGEAERPDGFGDRTGLATTFGFFERFLGIAAVRDGIRQSALDLCRVTQLVKQGGLALDALAGPGGVPRLDPARIAYLGESFGTVVGTLVAAIEPDLDLFVLDVPGGGILDKLLPTSAEIGALALPLVEITYNPRGKLDRWNPLLGLMQGVIDGADPLTYAPHVLRDRFTIDGRPLGPRSVVAIEVVGDQVLSNQGTDALAQGLGLEVLVPHLDVPEGLASIASPAAGNLDGQTAVLVQYAPATHGANWSAERGTLRYQPDPDPDADRPFRPLPAPITIANPMYETLEQVLEILVTHHAGQAPRVRSTLAPVRDFDGDGRLDADDPAPYDPTR